MMYCYTEVLNRAKFAVGIAGTVLLLSACSSGAAEQASAQQAQELAASDTTRATLSIDAWSLLKRDDNAIDISGHDRAGKSVATFLVRIDDASQGSRAEVSVLSPEQAVVHLSNEGSIDGSLSDTAKALVTALYSDTGSAGVILPQASTAQSADAVGKSSEALSIGYAGNVGMWGGWWGSRVNTNVGSWCPNGGIRSSYDAFSDYGNSCWVNRWSSAQQNDCTINLHWGIPAFQSDTCHYYVYQNP